MGGVSGPRSGDAEATESPSTSPPDGDRRSVNKPVFIAAAGSVLVFAVCALAAPVSAETVVGEVKSFISTWFGWWYFILSTAIVGLVIFIGASKYGHYRLGPEESRPEYSLFTCTSMLFAAGIGIDSCSSRWPNPSTTT